MACACHPSDGEMRGGGQKIEILGNSWDSYLGLHGKGSNSVRDPVSDKTWKVPGSYTQGCPLTSPHKERTHTHLHPHKQIHKYIHTKKVKEKKRPQIETIENTGPFHTEVETFRRL